MRGSFRRSKLNSLGGMVGGALQDLGMRQKVLEHEAVEKWNEVVGPQVSASAAAERIRDGILYVCCKSSTWSSELALYKDDIAGRLNAAVGKKVVTDIRFSARGFSSLRRDDRNPASRAEGPRGRARRKGRFGLGGESVAVERPNPGDGRDNKASRDRG